MTTNSKSLQIDLFKQIITILAESKWKNYLLKAHFQHWSFYNNPNRERQFFNK